MFEDHSLLESFHRGSQLKMSSWTWYPVASATWYQVREDIFNIRDKV
jgi:hypothetical protein